MLHMLEKGEYPEGYRYWSNAAADLTTLDGRKVGPEELPVQSGRVLDELWSDGYGVECYLAEWDKWHCAQLSTMYDESYAAGLGKGYPELVELVRGHTKELGAERPGLHAMFTEDVDQRKAGDPFTEIWVVMPRDVDVDTFHEVADWLDSRCRLSEQPDMEALGDTSAVPLPRAGLEERGTPCSMRGWGFEIDEEAWWEGLFKCRDVYIA